MQKKIIYIIISVSILTTAILVLFFTTKGQGTPDFVPALDANPEVFNRTFVDIEEYHTYDLADSNDIFVPAGIRLTHDKIYISDFSDFTIYEYDKNGTISGTITAGRGNGPGEFQHLSDFDLIRDTLWAVDLINHRVSSFSVKTGEFITSFSVDRQPTRITCLSDGLIVQWMGSELLFSKFDFDGRELKHFGSIIENQLQNPLSLDGVLISNRNDRFVYVPMYASLIYQYTSDGNIINILKAPDGHQFPVARRQSLSNGNRQTAPDIEENYVMIDAIIDEDDKLYVYVARAGQLTNEDDWKENALGIFDIYNLTEGEYEGSFKVPFNHVRAKFDSKNNRVYSTTGYEGKALIHQLKS